MINFVFFLWPQCGNAQWYFIFTLLILLAVHCFISSSILGNDSFFCPDLQIL